MREHFEAKRGAGRTDSLEANAENPIDPLNSSQADSPLAALEQKELAASLSRVLAELKPPADLEPWEKAWPARKTAAVKVVNDRSAGEMRVTGVSKGRRFQRTFPVEQDLTAKLRLASEFIRSKL